MTTAEILSQRQERASLLLKKVDMTRLLRLSSARFEELLAEGRLPQPIWLGETTHSRRWVVS